MKKHIQVTFVIVLLLALICTPLITILNTVNNKNEVSYYENRILTPIPDLTFDSLWNGSFASTLNDYLNDHFVGRNRLIKMDILTDLILKRPTSHEIVVTDQRLLPFHGFSTWELDYLTKLANEMGDELSAVRDVVEANGGILIYLGIPQQYSYFREDYPDYMDDRSWVLNAIGLHFSNALQERAITFLQASDVYNELGHPEEFYSSADHHYTYRGMLAAYRMLMAEINRQKKLDLTIYSDSELSFKVLSNTFLGSLNRMLFGQWPSDEKIEIATLKEPISFTRIDNGIAVPATLYNIPMEDELISYSVYMGGDIAETIIRTDRPELPKLLIWGDSFTNSMETLLWASFDETRSLDFRYYSEKNLTDYISEFQPDVVVCIRDDTSYLNVDGNGNLS